MSKKNENHLLPELLAPCGSFACVKAAVQNGADAVYLGLNAAKSGRPVLNARAAAENFTFETLKKALYYAHLRDVKVYLTLNTLLKPDELTEAYDAAMAAAEWGADAVIIQDLGLARMLLQPGPGGQRIAAQVHASTQMSIYNEEGLRFLKELGFDRCITARELSLSELKALCDTGLLDIECFCHGALCMSVSGQCLMSSYLGGRSGNRGCCAQPCRLQYAVDQGPFAYRLSPADLCALPYLDRLVATGVRSIKIEGRLKAPEYVAAVTQKYRQALNRIADGTSFCTQQDTDTLRRIFSRGPFTSGHQPQKMPLSHITYNTSGRLGVFCGTLTGLPKKLPAPPGLPQRLVLYEVTAVLTRPLHKNDGLSIGSADSEQAPAGGVINTLRPGEREGSFTMTIAGSCDMPRILPDAPVYLTHDSVLFSQYQQHGHENDERRKCLISGRFIAKIGAPAQLLLQDDNGNRITVSAPRALTAARTAPTQREDVLRHLSKLGDTPYQFSELILEIEENVFLPTAQLNALRREATEQLTVRRSGVSRFSAVLSGAHRPPEIQSRRHPDTGHINALFYYHTQDFYAGKDFHLIGDGSRIYLSYEAFFEPQAKERLLRAKRQLPQSCRLMMYFPYFTVGSVRTQLRKLLSGSLSRESGSLLPDGICSGFLITNAGDFHMLRALRPDKSDLIACDFSLNVWNPQAAAVMTACGADSITVPPELSAAEMLQAAFNIQNTGAVPELIAFGRIPLMRSRHCILSGIGNDLRRRMPEGAEKNASDEVSDIAAAEHCGRCASGQQHMLRDTKGRCYPLLTQPMDCQSVLLSHSPISDGRNMEQWKKKLRNAIFRYYI